MLRQDEVPRGSPPGGRAQGAATPRVQDESRVQEEARVQEEMRRREDEVRRRDDLIWEMQERLQVHRLSMLTPNVAFFNPTPPTLDLDCLICAAFRP